MRLIRVYRLSELPSLFGIYGDFLRRLETLGQDYTAESGNDRVS